MVRLVAKSNDDDDKEIQIQGYDIYIWDMKVKRLYTLVKSY